jgi:hypothetical protein
MQRVQTHAFMQARLSHTAAHERPVLVQLVLGLQKVAAVSEEGRLGASHDRIACERGSERTWALVGVQIGVTHSMD